MPELEGIRVAKTDDEVAVDTHSVRGNPLFWDCVLKQEFLTNARHGDLLPPSFQKHFQQLQQFGIVLSSKRRSVLFGIGRNYALTEFARPGLYL